MEKSFIVKFVKEKRKGVYNAIVQTYSTILNGHHTTLMKNLIEIDLEKNTGERIELNYDSLIKAVRRSLINNNRKSKRGTPFSPKANRYDFKDDHEIDESKKSKPGSFKI
ncbi:MAG: hypothetical protein JST48_08165 [Bacteroidetes bacterium]|nr:hypothetical protein [Bacteroidota bacterium]